MHKCTHREHEIGLMEKADTARKGKQQRSSASPAGRGGWSTGHRRQHRTSLRDALPGQRAPRGSCKRPPCQQEPLRNDLQLNQALTHQLCRGNSRCAGFQAQLALEMRWGQARRSLTTAAKSLRGSKWDVEVVERGSKHGRALSQLWAEAPSKQERSREEHVRYPKWLRGLCLCTTSSTLCTCLVHWQHWSYFYPHWEGTRRDFWSHGGHRCSVAL